MAKLVDWKNLNQKLLLNEDKYVKYKPLRIFCGTFNVNGKSPDETLTPWLCADNAVDVYAIGFQELVDLTTTSLLLKTDWNEKEKSWTEFISAELADKRHFKHKYKLVKSVRMFGLYLLVYVSEKLWHHKKAVHDVIASSVATGILTVGNKGSVAISLRIYETRLCFVCSHFAADTDKLEKRNADFRSTRQYLKFLLDEQAQTNNNNNSGSSSNVNNNSNNSSSSNTNGQEDYIDLDQHDVVFWFGDLNYRVDNVNLVDTLRLIYSSEFDELAQYDQLSRERAKSRVFECYSEGKLTFRPTYKYLIKSDVYEKHAAGAAMAARNSESIVASPSSSSLSSSTATLASSLSNTTITTTTISTSNGSEVQRVKLPSWTDRVLWKTSSIRVELLKYMCVNTITISDHKPVCAVFEAHTKRIDVAERDKLIQHLIKESDRKINEEMPHISIDKYEFNFGECMYYDAVRLDMCVRNEGVSKCTVDVIFYDPNNPDESPTASAKETTTTTTNSKLKFDDQLKAAVQASAQRRSIKRLHNPCQWISIFPQHKERVDTASHFSVQLTTSFSPHLLARLNRKPQVDDFLIVRCLNGNDSFATIGCKYKPSIIGFSLKALATLDAQTTFEQCDREHLVERFERDIAAFEQQLGLLVSNFVRDYSNQLQKFNAEKLLAEVSSGNSGSSNAKLKQSSSSSWSVPNNMATIESVAQSRLDMYKNCLLEMRNEIVDNDPHFHLPLSPEYTFLLQHLTDRCYKILNTSDDNQPQQQQQPQPAQQELLVDIGDRSSVPLATWPARATSSNALAIEEQKSMVLRLLSTRSFNEFEQANFDLELLAEVLNDLLVALPQPLVPRRFVDVCSYAAASGVYVEAEHVFAYMPRAHVQLFHMIVRFLQVYLKCLSSCDTDFHNILAESIFQLKSNQLAAKFLALFIHNYERATDDTNQDQASNQDQTLTK